MTPQQFIAKWQRVNLSERSACQQHFLDLCDLLGQPKPAEADPDGEWYTFEYGVKKTGGGNGWADVWMRAHFGWEYKGKHKNLKEAYRQLLLYREALENPPLLVVCDMDRFEVHTNFTSTSKIEHVFDLAGLADPANLDILRKLFTDPDALRPGITSEKITIDAAERFAKLAEGMRQKGIEPLRAAHFLMKLMFCMFGEDTALLPHGLFGRLLETAKANPAMLPRLLQNLFDAMAHGGTFGADVVAWFNGGLFADSDVHPLTLAEINTLAEVNKYDWASVEPSIFGTLFERTLDPSKRSQIGAHYTSRQDIETLLVPVVLAPLRGEWEAVRQRCEEDLWPKVVKTSRGRVGRGTSPTTARSSPQRKAFDRALLDFAERLAHVTLLDPACGSGNFLYVGLHMLLDLEKEVIAYAAMHGLNLLPHVNPGQLAGLEINPYAQQLAQVVIWIGYLQWMHHNGFKMPSDPVLAPIESVRCMDAILDLSDPEHPKEPEWPEAEFIVGNPPFLGGKMLRSNLGDEYVDAMFRLWDERVPREADLCCYWFEKARQQIERKKCRHAGLLATQGIRGGANVKVLQQVKRSGDVFFAIKDRDWVLEGANVHVSLIGFDDGSEEQRLLDGATVASISAELTGGTALISARRLPESEGVSFMGVTPAGTFDIDFDVGRAMLLAPNPNGRPNSDVIRPYLNGKDLNQRPRDRWTIDFGTDGEMDWAAGYEEPFEYVDRVVRPARATNNREAYRLQWWLYAEPRPAMRSAFAPHSRYLATCMVAKHRILTWLPTVCVPANVVIVFARSDDYFFGIVHSRVHRVWAYARGTQLREKESGDRYTPTTCFETFPFPTPVPAACAAIAAAAKELDDLRTRWLNPPEWTRTEVLEFPGSLGGPWARYINVSGTLRVPLADSRTPFIPASSAGKNPAYSPSGTRSVPDTIGTVRWPRLVPRDADCAASLSKRTLTNLYNQRPAWLDLAHRKLDEAVFAAYGWDPGISDEELLERLLALNLERARTAT